jgi:hypothetical protein
MDKLVERESAPRNTLVAAPALAVQFFLIPLAVVAVIGVVYLGFRSMVVDSRGPHDYLAEVRNGGTDRRWPAAYELSRLMDDPKVRADRSLAPALVEAFEQAKDDDPRIRRYLALAIGRLDPPLPAHAIDVLSKSLDEPDRVPATPGIDTWISRLTGWSDTDLGEVRISTIWALGASGDPRVAERLLRHQSPDLAQNGGPAPALPARSCGGAAGGARCPAGTPAAGPSRRSARASSGDDDHRGYVEHVEARKLRRSGSDPRGDNQRAGAAAALKAIAREPIALEPAGSQWAKVRQALRY